MKRKNYKWTIYFYILFIFANILQYSIPLHSGLKMIISTMNIRGHSIRNFFQKMMTLSFEITSSNCTFFGFYSTAHSIFMRIFCNMYSSLWKRLKNICSDEKSCFYHFLLQKYTILKLYIWMQCHIVLKSGKKCNIWNPYCLLQRLKSKFFEIFRMEWSGPTCRVRSEEIFFTKYWF